MHQELRERFIARLCFAPFKAEKKEEAAQQTRIKPRQIRTPQAFNEKNFKEVGTPLRNNVLREATKTEEATRETAKPTMPKAKDWENNTINTSFLLSPRHLRRAISFDLSALTVLSIKAKRATLKSENAPPTREVKREKFWKTRWPKYS